MAALLQQYPFKSTSIDPNLSEDDTDVSLIYAFLPPVVRRTVPKVRSLRRSFGSYRSFGSHYRNLSSDSDSGRRTPPPAYHETIVPLTAVLSDDEGRSSLDSSSTTSAGKRTSFVEDSASGIQWKYASQGLNLYTLSAQESTNPSDASFSRQLYVDAATYLLRGLPEDLTEEELISLRAATPSSLATPQAPVGQVILRNGGSQDVETESQEEHEPTVLHRIVSMAVFQFFLVFSFLWPYIQVFGRSAYAYERSHRISERFATSTWSTANAIGKRTLATANVVCTWNDGQVGETLESIFAWWVQSVASGLCEGVGEGMEVLGINPSRVQRRKGSGARASHA